MIFYFIAAEFQYKALVKNMLTEDAVITDIETDYHIGKYRSGHTQDIQISCTVDGITYNRNLGTDTAFFGDAGKNTFFEVGDVIRIFYNPENPEQIATELSLKSSRRGLALFAGCLVFFTFVFILILKGRKNSRVTEEEYRER